MQHIHNTEVDNDGAMSYVLRVVAGVRCSSEALTVDQGNMPNVPMFKHIKVIEIEAADGSRTFQIDGDAFEDLDEIIAR